jgi:TonB family protein
MEALKKEDYENAVEHFQQAAADKPDNMWAFYYLGLCLLKLKRFNEAGNAYQQAMGIKPMSAAVHYQLGKVYLELSDREAAEKERQWLQEHDQELALYLSDLLSDKPSSQQPPEAIGASAGNKSSYEPMTKDLRPNILYREKAKYTEIARTNRVEGTVVLQAVFASNGEMQNIRAIRKLPDGLTQKAIEATKKIRFDPAIKNGEPTSVRGNLEFTFNLY